MQTAGPYRLQRALSTCQVGDVWSGVDDQGHSVTVAVLNERASVDDRWRDAFAAAADALAQAGADRLPIVAAEHDTARPWVACAVERGPGAAQIFAALGQRLEPAVEPTAALNVPAALPTPAGRDPRGENSPSWTAFVPQQGGAGGNGGGVGVGAGGGAPVAGMTETAERPAAGRPWDLPPTSGAQPGDSATDRPTSAVPTSAAPTSGLPTTVFPTSAQPTAPTSAQPYPPAAPASGQPYPSAPASGQPYPSAPASGQPGAPYPAPGQPGGPGQHGGGQGPGWPAQQPGFDANHPVSGHPDGPMAFYPIQQPGQRPVAPVSGLPGETTSPPYPSRVFGDQPAAAPRRRTGLLLTAVGVVALLVGIGGTLGVVAAAGGFSDDPAPQAGAPAPVDPAQLLLPADAPRAPGVEPPQGGGWPANSPTFGRTEPTKTIAGLEGVGFDFRVPPSWACTKVQQAAAAVHYRCGLGQADQLTSGGDLWVRSCQTPCTEARRGELRQKEEAWGRPWIRSGPFVTWAETNQIDGKPLYGLVYVGFWRSTPEGQIDKQLVLRMSTTPTAANDLRKVANSIRDSTFTL